MRKCVFDIKWRELREGDLVSMKHWEKEKTAFLADRHGLVVGVHPRSALLERVTVLCEGEFYQKMPGQLTVVSDGPLDKI